MLRESGRLAPLVAGTAAARTSTVRVLVGERHPATRVGLRASLTGAGFEVCAEVDGNAEAVALARRERPQVCLLATDLTEGAVGAVQAITQELADTVVLVLADEHDDREMLAALAAGASGYLTKDIRPRELVRAVEGVLAGQAALSRRATVTLATEYARLVPQPTRQQQAADSLRPLTPRQWEVLDLVRAGRTTIEIARDLDVSPVTIRSHLWAIHHRLGTVADEAAEARTSAGQPAVNLER